MIALAPVKIALVYNEASGRGRGAAAAAAVESAAAGAGHSVVRVPVRSAGIDDALHAADVAVVAGGDGTVHSLLPRLVRSAAAIYHFPLGTENLFARQFRMNRDLPRLLGALEGGRVVRVDVPRLRIEETAAAGNGDGKTAAQETPFVLMCSVGPDASVVRRLAKVRTGPISHLSYALPILGELCDPYLPRITVRVDGAEIVNNTRGMAIIANSRQYATRIDPAARASMHDGLLDVVFFPCRHALAAGAWLLSSRLRRHTRNKHLVYAQGARVELVAEGEGTPAYQVDGEAGRECAAPLRLSMSFGDERVAQQLRVLLPAEGLGVNAGIETEPLTAR